MSNRRRHFSRLITASFTGLLLLPLFADAQIINQATEYVPLSPIPGATKECAEDRTLQCTSFALYLANGYKAGLALAGALAFLMIVIGGFQYMSTDASAEKSEGKQRVIGAVSGLILAFASFIFLRTINTRLVNWDLNFGGPVKRAAPVDLDLISGSRRTEREMAAYTKSLLNDLEKGKAEATKLRNEAEAIRQQIANDLERQEDGLPTRFTPTEMAAKLAQADALLKKSEALGTYTAGRTNMERRSADAINSIAKNDIPSAIAHKDQMVTQAKKVEADLRAVGDNIKADQIKARYKALEKEVIVEANKRITRQNIENQKGSTTYIEPKPLIPLPSQ